MFLISAIGFLVFKKCAFNPIFALGVHLAFALVVVMFTMRVRVDNPVLRWCGKYLFEIYILQRISMIVFDKTGLLDWNYHIGFILCAVITGLAIIPFRKLCDKAWQTFVK